MAIVLMTDKATGRVAIFEENGTSGDPEDPNSTRNAPLNNPASHLSRIYYHSDYDPIEVAVGPANVTISHEAIPAGSGPGGQSSFNGWLVYGGFTRTHTLLSHGLGYVPDFAVAVNNQTLHPGYPVQYNAADGRARCVTAYATSSAIRLSEFGIQSSVSLPALNVTYNVMVYARPPAPSGNNMIDFDSATGVLKMARNKFSSDRQYLQIVSGGSPFGFPLGKTIDLSNGTFRSVQPNGAIRDVVPEDFRVSFGEGGPSYGPTGEYKGSFTGGGAIQVQAP